MTYLDNGATSFPKAPGVGAAVAAYLDYNRVYVADWGRKPLLYQFDSTKEAVGYYADWLDRHASDEAAVAAQRPEALQKAKAVRWENTEVEK